MRNITNIPYFLIYLPSLNSFLPWIIVKNIITKDSNWKIEPFFVQDFLVAAVLINKNQSKLPVTKQYIFFPFLAILFCWYFFICTQRENRERVTVEEIHNFPVFVTYFVICLIFLSILYAVDIPAVHFLIDHNVSLDTRLK